jgi:ABC-type bacteriocin/lantibiotic exporter with double-glycine peptidase domain
MSMSRWIAVLAVGGALAGCYTGSAHTVTPAAIGADPGWLVVRGVPFFEQTGERDCGAAALAMVLQYWEVSVTPDQIAVAHPGSRGQGLRAGQLRDFARTHGLEAFVIAGQPADLKGELERGRPVIVGLGKPYGPKNLAHYEVLVGLHRDRQGVLTLDPDHGWRENTLEGFAAEWAAGQQLLLVVFRRAGI